jgi:serine protease
MKLAEGPPTFCDPSTVDKLVAELQKRPEIEHVHALRVGRPPSSTGTNANIDAYLGAATQAPPSLFHGLDIDSCRAYPGGTGSGIKLVDIEAGWNYTTTTPPKINHVALPSTIQHLGGTVDDNNGWRYHGMNVLGILFMNSQISPQGPGVAPDGQGYTMGIDFPYPNTGQPVFNIANSILQATMPSNVVPGVTLGPGDVILLEYQVENDGVSDLPVESSPEVFSAIRIAVALGITVIEAAGNGNNNLDSITGFNRSTSDSGAILVGACEPTTLAPWSPDPGQGTNYGSRIDVFAWGQDVATTGSDHDDNTVDQSQAYCPDPTQLPPVNSFGGTSAASAIVAGAAMIIQSIAKQKLGSPFSPNQLRTLLTTYGTPSGTDDPDPTNRNPANGLIGVMPNLRSLVGSFMQGGDRNRPHIPLHPPVVGPPKTSVPPPNHVPPKTSTPPPTHLPPKQPVHPPV